jgi:PhnB protein
MSIQSVSPYLFFNGDAEKAIALYERALGAKTLNVMRFGDHPEACAEGADGKILHAELEIGGAKVMVSDTRPDMGVTKEGNVSVTLEHSDVESQTKAFEAMAVGGNVQVPLQDAFWGGRFGVLTDAHGINWMFNCALGTK